MTFLIAGGHFILTKNQYKICIDISNVRHLLTSNINSDALFSIEKLLTYPPRWFSINRNELHKKLYVVFSPSKPKFLVNFFHTNAEYSFYLIEYNLGKMNNFLNKMATLSTTCLLDPISIVLSTAVK